VYLVFFHKQVLFKFKTRQLAQKQESFFSQLFQSMLGKRKRNYIDKEAEKWSRYEEYIAMEGFKVYFVRG